MSLKHNKLESEEETDKTVRERLKDIKGDINLLIARLDSPPKKLRDLSSIYHEGWLFMTKSGKLHWKKYFVRLTGDVLNFYAGPSVTNVKTQTVVCFKSSTSVTEEDTLTGKQVKEGLFCNKRIKLITIGEMLDVSFESDDLAVKWDDILNKMLHMKYQEDEIKEKEESRNELEPLLKAQQELMHEKYSTILMALADSGFWIGKEKKIREGYCYLKRPGKTARKLYCVLYKDFFYFFKPQARVSMNERPYEMINLKFVTACDMENAENLFSVTTPLRKFTLRTKHEVALQEWVSKIRETAEKKNKRLAPMKKIQKKELDDHGYKYSKPIQKYMSVIEVFEDGRQKVHKLKGVSTTIGRSSSNDITLTADKYISRSHCKIVVENNVPYLMDLGQAKEGTKLNGKRIKKTPLKPGDRIGMGKSDITFRVKNGDAIFTEEKSKENNDKENNEDDDPSFSTSAEEMPLVVGLDD